jgi:16S rRNA (cytosine967-C5)-methyltransferase
LLLEENEQIAEAFSAAHPEFALLPAAEVLTQAGVENAVGLCSGAYLRLWPHQHHTDGFFAAVWQKS